MLDNFFTARGNRDVVIEKDPDNNMDGACEQ